MKPAWKSKTIIYNVATGLAILLSVLGSYGITPDSETVTKAAEINVMLAPLVNIFLRKITTQAIG